MWRTRLYQKGCKYQDKSVITSYISSGKSASRTELKIVFTKWIKPSISCLAFLCTLSAFDCQVEVFSADGGHFRIPNSVVLITGEIKCHK